MNNKPSTKVRRRQVKATWKDGINPGSVRSKESIHRAGWRNRGNHPSNMDMLTRHGAKHPLLMTYIGMQQGLIR